MKLHGAINHLAYSNKSFVCYRLPNNSDPVLLADGKFSKPDFNDETLCGFLFVPFDLQGSCPPLIYTGGTQFSGWDNQLNYSADIPPPKAGYTPSTEYPCLGKAEYMTQAEILHEKLLNRELQKVVLSRVQCVALPQSFDLGSFFEKLCRKYVSAFVYIVHIDQSTCWVGASPEVLLQVENKEGSTMSLAGSISAQTPSPNTQWTQKELNENSFVLQYIMQKLLQAGIIEVSDTPLETVSAGPVLHLRKSLRFTLPEGVSPLKLALNLHPTPAVCGIPSASALKSIIQTEQHSRNYYAGFLGLVSGSENARLFVNLRCMHVIGQTAYIFVGGGLMPQSDLENEWNETQAKAETLLSVIKEYNKNV